MENILSSGRRRRFIRGVVLAVAAVATVVVLVVTSAGPGWFVLVFALSAGAALLMLQAREST